MPMTIYLLGQKYVFKSVKTKDDSNKASHAERTLRIALSITFIVLFQTYFTISIAAVIAMCRIKILFHQTVHVH